MVTNYPKRPIFAPSDALRKIEAEVEAIRQEVMAISNVVLMDPKVRHILSRKRVEETLVHRFRTGAKAARNSLIDCLDEGRPRFGMGHSRLARTGGRFGQVRCAPESGSALMSPRPSITVVSFCWRILLISESMDHHDSEIMDDRSID
jgi:hypothetical protein